MPFDRAGTPGQGHTGFDRLIVLLEPARKALEGLQCTGFPGTSEKFRTPDYIAFAN
jgi:hypothetical protein